ncbi:MAG: hypothetical protein WEC59_02305, partial [Salibacteraceae bacterium]
SDFYFYGKFDGRFIKWEDDRFAKWDTNFVYRNIPEENGDLPCINDSSNIWFEQVTRFIRPGIPEHRIEIFMYECIEYYDTILANPPFYDEILTNLSLLDRGTAQPFSATNYGRTGFKVVYTDGERNKWETKSGSGQLNDTYLRVTDFYPRDVTLDTLDTLGMFIIEGEFAGRLYNGNNEIPVTESKFRGRLVPRVSDN